MSWAEFLTSLSSGLFSIFCSNLDNEMQSFINFEDNLNVGREKGWKHFLKLDSDMEDLYEVVVVKWAEIQEGQMENTWEKSTTRIQEGADLQWGIWGYKSPWSKCRWKKFKSDANKEIVIIKMWNLECHITSFFFFFFKFYINISPFL